MFPRSQRIRKTHDLLAVLRRGRRVKSGVVTCSFLSKPATLSRITVIVDTKVSKLAVTRNLLKRRVRMILKESDLPAGDLVVRLWRGAADLSFGQLRAEVEQCLKRLT